MYQWTLSGLISFEKPSKKGGLTHNLNAIWLPEETVQEELTKAYGCYHSIKKTQAARILGLGN